VPVPDRPGLFLALMDQAVEPPTDALDVHAVDLVERDVEPGAPVLVVLEEER